MWSKLKPWTVPLILFGTSGCALVSTEPPVGVSDYCRVATPLAYDSAHDSAETVKAIEAHNSRWVCLCEKDCPND